VYSLAAAASIARVVLRSEEYVDFSSLLMAPSSLTAKILLIKKVIYIGFPHPQTEKESLYPICRSDPDTTAYELVFADFRTEITLSVSSGDGSY
jgi:hypothetical protein